MQIPQMEGVYSVTLFYSALEALLLVIALSMDAFVSGFAYGANKIKIPFSSMMIVNLICSLILGAALLFGHVIGGFLSGELAVGISAAILLCLGFSKIFDSAIKTFIRKHSGFRRKFEFSMFNLGFVLSVYADPEEADHDKSRSLSPAEAAYLAVALSLDGLAVGFGAGVSSINPVMVIAFSLVADLLCIFLGSKLGNHIAKKITLNLSWLSGILLIVLALLKLV